MQQKKRLALGCAALLLAAAVGLSACGGNRETTGAVPLTDANGVPLTDENGNTLTAVLQGEVVELTNIYGDKIYDENGEVRTTIVYGAQQIAVPVTDENGDFVYDEAGNLVTTMVEYAPTEAGTGGITGIPITDGAGNVVTRPGGAPLTYTAEFTVTPAVPGANTANWGTTFGGSGGDRFVAVAAMPDGGFAALVEANSKDGQLAGLAAAGSPTPVLLRYDKKGRVEWQQAIRSEAGVQVTGLAADEDGNLAVCGQTRATDLGFQNAGGLDAVVFCYNKKGEALWTTPFGTAVADGFTQIAAVPGGGFAVTGYSGAPFAAKLSADGAILWRAPAGAAGDSLTCVAADESGAVYAAGSFKSSGEGSLFTPYGRTDAGVVKFSADGKQAWAKQYGGGKADEFLALTLSHEGGVVAVGRSSSTDRDLRRVGNHGGFDALAVCFTESGEVAWQRGVSGLLDDCFTGVARTETGYALAGYTNSSNKDFRSVGNRGGTDAFTLELSADGKWIETTLQTYGGTRDDRFASVCTLKNGEMVLCGETLSADGDLVGVPARPDGQNAVGMIARFAPVKS